MSTTTPEASAAEVDRDYPLTPVPAHARKSFLSIAVVLLGFTIFAPTLMAGAQIGASFRFDAFCTVLVIGSLVLCSYVAAVGFMGARTGLTTVVMSRYTFGSLGAKFASILLGGTRMGWYGVVVGSIGEMTAQALHWEGWLPRAAVMVVASLLMAFTAYAGYEGMYWVSMVSTPLILILSFWILAKSLAKVGGLAGFMALEPTSTMSWAAAITTIMGTFASAGTQAANWTRFAKTGWHAIWACVIGFFVGNGLMIFFGATAALAFGQGDFTALLFSMGLVGWGLFFLFGNLWKSSADAAYAFVVAGAELFNRKSKGPFIIGGAVIGTLLALTGVQHHLIGYLSLLGIAIPPLGGVLLGDWLARWRTGQPALQQISERVRWQAFVPLRRRDHRQLGLERPRLGHRAPQRHPCRRAVGVAAGALGAPDGLRASPPVVGVAPWVVRRPRWVERPSRVGKTRRWLREWCVEQGVEDRGHRAGTRSS